MERPSSVPLFVAECVSTLAGSFQLIWLVNLPIELAVFLVLISVPAQTVVGKIFSANNIKIAMKQLIHVYLRDVLGLESTFANDCTYVCIMDICKYLRTYVHTCMYMCQYILYIYVYVCICMQTLNIVH